MVKKRTTVSRQTRTPVKRARPVNRKKGNDKLVNFVVPLFIIFCILFCVGFMFLMGYRTVTASSFFDLEEVLISGATRISASEIEKIVKINSVREGVWNADIDRMKHDIEKMRLVKSASVSRVLPNKFHVIVNERIPRAIVRIAGTDFWVDDDGLILNRVGAGEQNLPFTMFGWNRSKTNSAIRDNRERVSLYLQMKDEWTEYDLQSRVTAVDFSDLRDPRAMVFDSGEMVTIYLGKQDYRKALQRGLENIAGRGKEIEAIIVSGARPIIEYRNS